MWIDDMIIASCHQPLSVKVYRPDSCLVVMGSNNQPDSEVHVEHCQEDHLPIEKRRGGGGTVYLSPSSIIVSIGTWVKDYYESKKYFVLINDAIIASLAQKQPILLELKQSGISDIEYKGKKICGTSLYRSRNYLLFQGSILAKLDLPQIQRYLRHPSKEPDYRKNRPHQDFLTSLGDIVPEVEMDEWVHHLQSNLVEHLKVMMQACLDSPKELQISYLKKQDRQGL